MTGAGDVELHIDTLSIEGMPLSRGQRAQLQEAVELEVTRLLGLQRAAMTAARTSSGPQATLTRRIEAAPTTASADPRAFGVGIAASVVEAVTR